MFILVSIFLPIIIFIAPINVKAIQGNLDLSSAQTSVGKRFAKVFCDAKREGLDSDFASEYALNNTYLKFVAFPDDDEYLDDLWNFTHNNVLDNCGEFVDINDLKDLEIFFIPKPILRLVAFIISVKSKEFGAHLRTSRLKM